MSETPRITLTGEAQELIVNLVRINSKCKEQKYLLFTNLYDLWKKDLDAGSNPGNKFSGNVVFIKATILNSYSEIDRNAHRVHRILASGSAYQTTYGVIIPSNVAEIGRAEKCGQ